VKTPVQGLGRDGAKTLRMRGARVPSRPRWWTLPTGATPIRIGWSRTNPNRPTLSSHLDPNTDPLSAIGWLPAVRRGNRHARFTELPMRTANRQRPAEGRKG